jgi:hypothetical protein
MVKDNGTEETVTGNNRYFISCNNYQVLRDPIVPNIVTVIMYVPVRDLNINRAGRKQIIPIHPEANVMDLNKKTERAVVNSIKEVEGDTGIFHYKSQGIKILVDKAEINEQSNQITLHIKDHTKEGIVDGANLYKAISEVPVEDIDKNVYVKVEVIVGLDLRHGLEITRALDSKIAKENTVKIESRELAWIKQEVDTTPYKGKIDTVKVLALINLFRNNAFDADINNQPTESYWDKNLVIRQYKENPKAFQSFQPMIRDILYLYDYINVTTQEIWPSKKGSFGSLGLGLPYKQKGYEWPMMNQKTDYSFHEAISFILLNGIRSFVIFNIDGRAIWSKEFSKILDLYEAICVELIDVIRDFNQQNGFNPHLLGKNKMIYSMIYKEFLMGDMLNQFL